jgi:hypothetical protein
MKDATDKKSSLADDLVWGGQAIGDEIGLPKHKAFYALERGYLPANKVGNIWVASRKKLRAALGGDEAA